MYRRTASCGEECMAPGQNRRSNVCTESMEAGVDLLGVERTRKGTT